MRLGQLRQFDPKRKKFLLFFRDHSLRGDARIRKLGIFIG